MPVLVEEDGGWSVLLPGTPLAADATHLADAVDDFVEALQEYASDWSERLADTPNHAPNADLVDFVSRTGAQDLRQLVTQGYPLGDG